MATKKTTEATTATATGVASAGQRSASPAAAKTVTAKKAAVKTTPAQKSAVKAAPAKKVLAQKTPVETSPVKKAAVASSRSRGSAQLKVKDDESPWSAAEINETRSVLVAEIETHEEEVRLAEAELDVLLRDAGDGAGSDEADAGTMTAERVHEIALANNAHASLEQARHALEQLEAGTYGVCENCGLPIGKLRLQARPRATLCMPCQAKQDRH